MPNTWRCQVFFLAAVQIILPSIPASYGLPSGTAPLEYGLPALPKIGNEESPFDDPWQHLDLDAKALELSFIEASNISASHGHGGDDQEPESFEEDNELQRLLGGVDLDSITDPVLVNGTMVNIIEEVIIPEMYVESAEAARTAAEDEAASIGADGVGGVANDVLPGEVSLDELKTEMEGELSGRRARSVVYGDASEKPGWEDYFMVEQFRYSRSPMYSYDTVDSSAAGDLEFELWGFVPTSLYEHERNKREEELNNESDLFENEEAENKPKTVDGVNEENDGDETENGGILVAGSEEDSSGGARTIQYTGSKDYPYQLGFKSGSAAGTKEAEKKVVKTSSTTAVKETKEVKKVAYTKVEEKKKSSSSSSSTGKETKKVYSSTSSDEKKKQTKNSYSSAVKQCSGRGVKEKVECKTGICALVWAGPKYCKSSKDPDCQLHPVCLQSNQVTCKSNSCKPGNTCVYQIPKDQKCTKYGCPITHYCLINEVGSSSGSYSQTSSTYEASSSSSSSSSYSGKKDNKKKAGGDKSKEYGGGKSKEYGGKPYEDRCKSVNENSKAKCSKLQTCAWLRLNEEGCKALDDKKCVLHSVCVQTGKEELCKKKCGSDEVCVLDVDRMKCSGYSCSAEAVCIKRKGSKDSYVATAANKVKKLVSSYKVRACAGLNSKTSPVTCSEEGKAACGLMLLWKECKVYGDKTCSLEPVCVTGSAQCESKSCNAKKNSCVIDARSWKCSYGKCESKTICLKKVAEGYGGTSYTKEVVVKESSSGDANNYKKEKITKEYTSSSSSSSSSNKKKQDKDYKKPVPKYPPKKPATTTKPAYAPTTTSPPAYPEEPAYEYGEQNSYSKEENQYEETNTYTSTGEEYKSETYGEEKKEYGMEEGGNEYGGSEYKEPKLEQCTVKDSNAKPVQCKKGDKCASILPLGKYCTSSKCPLEPGCVTEKISTLCKYKKCARGQTCILAEKSKCADIPGKTCDDVVSRCVKLKPTQTYPLTTTTTKKPAYPAENYSEEDNVYEGDTEYPETKLEECKVKDSNAKPVQCKKGDQCASILPVGKYCTASTCPLEPGCVTEKISYLCKKKKCARGQTCILAEKSKCADIPGKTCDDVVSRCVKLKPTQTYPPTTTTTKKPAYPAENYSEEGEYSSVYEETNSQTSTNEYVTGGEEKENGYEDNVYGGEAVYPETKLEECKVKDSNAKPVQCKKGDQCASILPVGKYCTASTCPLEPGCVTEKISYLCKKKKCASGQTCILAEKSKCADIPGKTCDDVVSRCVKLKPTQTYPPTTTTTKKPAYPAENYSEEETNSYTSTDDEQYMTGETPEGNYGETPEGNYSETPEDTYSEEANEETTYTKSEDQYTTTENEYKEEKLVKCSVKDSKGKAVYCKRGDYCMPVLPVGKYCTGSTPQMCPLEPACVTEKISSLCKYQKCASGEICILAEKSKCADTPGKTCQNIVSRCAKVKGSTGYPPVTEAPVSYKTTKGPLYQTPNSEDADEAVYTGPLQYPDVKYERLSRFYKTCQPYGVAKSGICLIGERCESAVSARDPCLYDSYKKCSMYTATCVVGKKDPCSLVSCPSTRCVLVESTECSEFCTIGLQSKTYRLACPPVPYCMPPAKIKTKCKAEYGPEPEIYSQEFDEDGGKGDDSYGETPKPTAAYPAPKYPEDPYKEEQEVYEENNEGYQEENTANMEEQDTGYGDEQDVYSEEASYEKEEPTTTTKRPAYPKKQPNKQYKEPAPAEDPYRRRRKRGSNMSEDVDEPSV